MTVQKCEQCEKADIKNMAAHMRMSHSIPKGFMPPASPTSETVSKAEFTSLADSVAALAKMMQEDREAKTLAATPAPMQELLKEAEPKYNAVNPNITKIGEEILKDVFDHAEEEFPPEGGHKVTFVIRTDKSNAAKDHLLFYDTDRSTGNIERREFSGIEGAKKFAMLIAKQMRLPGNENYKISVSTP